MALNLSSAVHLELPGYAHVSTRPVGARQVRRYQLISEAPGEVGTAAQTVHNLVRENPTFTPTFDSSLPSLRELIPTHPYLVVNGQAICLSTMPAATGADSRLFNRYFSEAFTEEPVRCREGHFFERRHIVIWTQRRGDVCPAGAHSVGPLDIDPEALDDIHRHREARQVNERREREAAQRAQEQADRVEALFGAHQVEVQRALSEHRVERGIEITGGAGKLTLKGVLFLLHGLEVGGNVLFKGLAKEAIGKLPIIAFFVGIGLGIYRLTQGEYVRAAAEVISGALAGFLPGPGTVASVTLDLALFGYDIYETKKGDVEIKFSIERAHQTLGLDPRIRHTREAIEGAHRRVSRAVHPDRMQRLGEYTVDQCTQLQQMVNQSRDDLMRHYRFT